jgi:hypothetical protein
VKRRKDEMGRRYIQPRYARPREREKDEDLEEAIRQVVTAANEAKLKREKEKDEKGK